MKILAIRLRNLASLPGPVEIDFTAPPLARAGLYAIVGPTGAGKSTLLDALCLALFGKTPRLRLAPGRTSTTPDGDNDPIATADPRTLLRRGCSGGYAEVEFLGQDQRRYRSRWEVRRARGRAGGRLQAVERSLVDVDAEVILTTQTQEHEALVEQRLGLSFDQFTRAVLLAQAEFGAFLKAGDKERAELLEKLTDTARFSRISKAAYARKRSADASVERIRQESGGIAPLPEVERMELDAELSATQQRLAAWNDRQLALAGLIGWWDQQREQQGVLQRMREELTLRERAHGELTADRARLGELDLIAPLRDDWREARRLNSALAENARLALELQRALAGAEDERTRADHARQAAVQAQTEVRAAILAGEPHLREAQALETELALGIEESARRDRLRHQAHERFDAAIATRDAAVAAEEQAQESSRGVAHELAVLAPWRALQQGWAAHRLSLQEMVSTHAGIEQIEHKRQPLQVRLTTAQAALQKALADAATATIEHAQAQGELTASPDQAQALGLVNERLLDRQTALATLAREAVALREIGTLRARRDALHARIGELDGQARATVGMLDSAQAALTQAHLARLALQALIERLQLARSTEVAALRAQLVDGDACPVCGSAEHPYADVHAVQALFEQADAAELVRAQNVETDAREHWQRLQQQRADVAARLAEGAFTLSGHDADLAQRLDALADNARVAEIAQHGADAVLVRLQQEQLTSEQALAATRAGRDQLLERQRQRERLSERRDAALARRDEASDRRQGALAECAGAGLALETLATRQQQLREQWDARRVALGPLLPPADSERLASAPAAARDAIEMRVVRIDKLLQEQQALLQAQGERAQARELAQHDHAAAQALLAGAAAALAEQVAHLKQRREDLRGRLGTHADAASWRLQQTHARERTDAAADVAAAALQRASQHCAALVERNAALGVEAAAYRNALVSPAAQIQAFLASTPTVDPALLDHLCAQPLEVVASLRQRIEAADTQLFAARLRISERSDALAAHAHGRERLWARFHGTLNAPPALSEIERPLWAGLVPRRELDADERGELESAHTMSRRHCGAASAELDDLRLRQREDEGRRLARVRVQRELALALREQQRWGQISELIGSADGAAFRAIAQAYNLDLLLAHANEHLTQLAPRFSLQRSGSDLGLLVNDRDMGGSVRSVHSLSGGESFLTSLALALGLAAMSSRRLRIESLFIDEGFGVLDPQALDLALNALDGLQSLGRKVGVISHVAEMLERIPVQIRVQRMGQGTSVVEVIDASQRL